ncbi:hypothetical protein PAECIP111893_02752 [Paenibacillus plantiphilus]|uniref:Hint domain-containing protein n=1 Tax=Paenibacillus plantiphilus TaxID=2905650 RepID=A0ABN8GNA8_9BACL|nr:polymorphic toxin-type HINT domain-containing protein [Paenibacillus plantiphilus]CAH1207671.1 hypothetical protein PAECIP111893_02752 [Paenibacillus plantiphilus]
MTKKPNRAALMILSVATVAAAVVKLGKKIPKMITGAVDKMKKNGETTPNVYKDKDALPCNCFTAGTKVLTDEGEKPIEEIEVGDKVLSRNEETGEQAYKEVVQLFQKTSESIYSIRIGDQTIEATGNHPFWVEGKEWVDAEYLEVGDVLLQSDGNRNTIDEITIEEFRIKKMDIW